jgi:hypothetical protein
MNFMGKGSYNLCHPGEMCCDPTGGVIAWNVPSAIPATLSILALTQGFLPCGPCAALHMLFMLLHYQGRAPSIQDQHVEGVFRHPRSS